MPKSKRKTEDSLQQQLNQLPPEGPGTVQEDRKDTNMFDPDATLGTPVAENDDDNLVLDLSEVQENQQYTTIPPGTYDAIIDDAEFGRSQRSSNPMITWTLKILGGEFNNRTLFYHTVLIQNSLPRLKKMLVRVAPEMDLSQFKPSRDCQQLVGRACQVKVRTRQFEGQPRNNVTDVLPPSVEQVSFLPT